MVPPSSDSPPATLNPNETADSDEETVCFCHGVSRGVLKQAIKDGADTLEKVQAETCASTGCGGCEWDVRALIEAAQKKS